MVVCVVVYQCFGAVADSRTFSSALLLKSENNTKYKCYALIAPAIVAQFNTRYRAGIRAWASSGFFQCIETALGATNARRGGGRAGERGTPTLPVLSRVRQVHRNQFPIWQKNYRPRRRYGNGGGLIKAMEAPRRSFVGPARLKNSSSSRTSEGLYRTACCRSRIAGVWTRAKSEVFTWRTPRSKTGVYGRISPSAVSSRA